MQPCDPGNPDNPCSPFGPTIDCPGAPRFLNSIPLKFMSQLFYLELLEDQILLSAQGVREGLCLKKT